MVTVSTTWTNKNPNTIWNKLAVRLGREPTNAEAIAEVKRILGSQDISPNSPHYDPNVSRGI